MVTIWRNCNILLGLSCYITVFCTTPICAAVLGYDSGTVIASFNSPQYIIVASDSRRTRTDTDNHSDDYCKVILLDRHVVFFATGLTSVTDNDREIVDALQTAKRVHVPSSSLLSDAKNWAMTIEHEYYAAAASNWQLIFDTPKDTPPGFLSQGIFEGFSNNGKFNLAKAIIESRLAGIIEQNVTSKTLPEDSKVIEIYGSNNMDQYVMDFWRGESGAGSSANDRAKAEVTQKGFAGEDADALMLQRAVDFAIAESGSPFVGGSVSVLIVYPDKDARWFARSTACGAR